MVLNPPDNTPLCNTHDETQRSDLESVQLLLAKLSGSQVETIPFEEEDHSDPLLDGSRFISGACISFPSASSLQRAASVTRITAVVGSAGRGIRGLRRSRADESAVLRGQRTETCPRTRAGTQS